MRQKKGREGLTHGGKQDAERTGINALGIYDTTNTRAMQAAVYPTGWLIQRLKTPPPANSITRRQARYLIDCIRAITLPAYRGYKIRLGIPLDLPLHRLTKGQAWLLINAITTDLEAAK